MEEIDKTIESLSDIKNPMSREGILILYSANNIRFERCELYSDFVQSLLTLIFDTYLGDDVTDSVEQIKHFKWCWGKNISNFKTEGFEFKGDTLYNYFLEFMLETYYPLTSKTINPKTNGNILKLWLYLLSYDNQKNVSDVDTMIDVYKLFDESLKK